MSGEDVTNLRLDRLEESVKVLAHAATEQVAFNASVKTWGKIGLLLYGAGQSVLVGALLYGVQRLAGGEG